LQELYVRSVHNERANTFLGALLRYRETNKLKQIVQTLIDAVNPDDGRIHTTFEQTIAATGRLSSTNPNLQNIPNRNLEGREIRSVFVPGEGFTGLLSSDYSQVELRIMAHLSGDEALIDAFKSGADFHKYVASLVYQIPVEEVSSDQRSHIKAMSYGLAYGLSTFGLSQQLKISPAEADVLRDKYFSTFGKVHDYLESLVSEARRKGYTETMFGRRRYFPGLRSGVRTVKAAAERAALNAPIQGSAADIMKIAMVKAGEALDAAGVRSRIILQIHDELVVEVAAGEEEQATELVKNAMEHAVDLDVPLDVSTGLGSDWQAAAH
jgi:DNA polymerase-1